MTNTRSRRFHLWTESYGGHWGPGFFRHFWEQNERIRNGTTGGRGVQLEMGSLGIINGLVSARVQYPFYPEFGRNNTYGIAVNEFTYKLMKLNMEMTGGCKTAVDNCILTDHLPQGETLCAHAHMVCTNLVVGPFTTLGGRDNYDIRAAANADIPRSRYWMDYVNTARVQDALGVDLNYTNKSSIGVNLTFALQGDQVRDTTFHDLEWLLAKGVRVALIYGDADFLCNWVGGEAVSLALKWPNVSAFANADYAPFTVAGSNTNKTYGETRQYGGLSFTRVYDADLREPRGGQRDCYERWVG
ncbi:hypothetical protein PG994_009777 [Apiospora phragmitis]|uniref:Carboxypeptidase n=1 Tax=Apiospora phragmitis TaxID=2905665 RepID=A0ABR1U9E1_9PEZI